MGPMNDYLSSYLSQHSNSSATPAVAGAISRFVANTVISPLDLIRTKMQSKKTSTQEIVKVIRTTIRHGGIKGLYLGWGPTMLRDVPFSMSFWFLVKKIRDNVEMESLLLKDFMTGMVSGSVSAILTLPFDVVKSNRQIQMGDMKHFNKSTRQAYEQIIRDIYTKRGFQGFFLGMAPRLLKVAPSCALMVTSYELSKRFFASYNTERW